MLTTVQLFVDAVDACHVSPSEGMRRLADAILAFRTLDKAMLRLVDECAPLPYCLFFHFSLLERPCVERRFLDGTFGVTLFVGSFGRGPSNIERFRRLSPMDVLKDRLASAKKLASFDETQVYARSSHYIPEDIPDGVGPRVAAFVGRCRLLTQCVAACATTVVHCGHCRCPSRVLNLGIGRIHPTMQQLFGSSGSNGSGASGASGGEEEDDEDEYDDYMMASSANAAQSSSAAFATSYWARLCPGVLATLPRVQFCSLECTLAYEAELAVAMPISVHWIDSHESEALLHAKTGLSRTVAVARTAAKRNTAAMRALRLARSEVRRAAATTLRQETIDAMHANVQDMLNVDLAIVTAAAAIAESPVLANGRILPGTAPGWRADARRWTRAIELTKSIYMANRGPETRFRALDPRDPPIWMRKARDAAPSLFPVQLLESSLDV